MRVQIQQILPEGLQRDEVLPCEWAEKELEGEATVLPPGVDVQVRLQLMGKEVLIQGKLHATLLYPCDRCLEEARQEVDVPFTLLAGMARPQDKIVDEEVELSDEDLDYVPIEANELVLDAIIREQLLLAIPMVRECRPDCRGLCPGCGHNLNVEACSCSEPPVDPRWEALKKFQQ